MLYGRKIKNVVLDFDGVIIDSERNKFQELQHLLRDANYTLDDSKFENFIGKKRAQFLKEIGVSGVDQIMQRIHERESEQQCYSLKDGMNDFLHFLKKENTHVHIATGSSREFVFKHLNYHNMRQFFQYIITGDDVQESKPNPKIYSIIKEKISSDSIIVIEDSVAGVVAAKKAFLFVIGFGDDLGADINISTFTKIAEFICESNNQSKSRQETNC